jgi:predicted metal-dependent peptidase
MAFGDNTKKPLAELIAWQIPLKQPYMSHILLGIEREITRAVKDIGIKFSGLSITFQFNPDYYDALPSYDQQMAFIVHNVVHLIYKHPLRLNSTFDKQLFDIACDLVVNQVIPEHYLEETAKLDMFKDFKLKPNETLDYYYYKLLQENQQMQQQMQQNPDDPQLNDSQQNLSDMLDKSDGPGNHEWVEVPEGEAGLISENIDDRLMDTHERMQRSQGHTPGYFTDIINMIIESRKPVVDWRKELLKFINNSSLTKIKNTVKRVSKRFGTNPGIKIQRLKRILVAVDTSGSVSLDDLAEFFAEIDHIWRANADIHIIECDAAISRLPYKYEGHPPTEISGRGGTSFQPVMDYILDGHFTPDCVIYFTDGECSAPTEYPDPRKIVWIICTTGSNNFDQLPGTVIKMMPD